MNMPGLINLSIFMNHAEMLTPRMKDAPRLKELFLSVPEMSFSKFAYLDCLIGGIFRSFLYCYLPKKLS